MAMAGAYILGAAGVVVSADGGFLPVCLVSFFSVVVVVPPGVLTSFFSVTVADSPQPTSPNVSVKRPVPARAVMSFFMVFLCPTGCSDPRPRPRPTPGRRWGWELTQDSCQWSASYARISCDMH